MNIPSTLMSIAATLGLAAGALACDPITFENLPTGTVVTTQYQGVTFSANAQTCPGPTNCLIVSPPGGTSSGTRGIALATGCPDFSPEGIRMVFDNLQGDIQFNIGLASAGTINVRAYNNAGGLAFNQNYTLSGAGVDRVVHITTLGGVKSLRRVEVASTVGDFEYIDDLVYDVDTSAPSVDLPGLADFQCVCPSSTINGAVTEPDSTSTCGLSVMRVGPGGGVWIQWASGTFPSGGTLGAPWPYTFAHDEGYYYIRIDAVNHCGLRSSDQRIVYLNMAAEMPVVRSPLEGDVVGGSSVCFDGTVSELCGVTYTVSYQASPGGAPAGPVNPATPTYTSAVVNDTVATWNTVSGPAAVPDGEYLVQISAVTSCLHRATLTRHVTVDNTPPTAVIISPLSCNHVDGMVSVVGIVNDLHLGGWALDYTGGDATGWVRISQGTAPMFYNVLGVWNTAGLRKCAYTLRLTAWDTASVNCGTANNSTERLVSVDLGCAADFDGSGGLAVADIFTFLNAWFAGCP